MRVQRNGRLHGLENLVSGSACNQCSDLALPKLPSRTILESRSRSSGECRLIGIAVWLPATVFTSPSWSQSQPDVQSRRGLEGAIHKFTGVFSPDIAEDYYPQEIRKSVERLPSEVERLAITEIIPELDKKSRDFHPRPPAPNVQHDPIIKSRVLMSYAVNGQTSLS